MSWSYDEVMAVFGDEVQATAGGLVLLRNEPGKPGEPDRLKHVLIAKFVGHTFVVTEDGIRLLDKARATEAEVVSERKKPARKPKAEPVEVVDEDALDDLDLS
jgi:hypothetical protein